jgi:hypothetical protein
MHHVRLALVLVLGMIVGSALLPPPSASAQAECVSVSCCDQTLAAAVTAGLLRAPERDNLAQVCRGGDAQVRALQATLGEWVEAMQLHPSAAPAARAAAGAPSR